jgi:hypothetical protein
MFSKALTLLPQLPPSATLYSTLYTLKWSFLCSVSYVLFSCFLKTVIKFFVRFSVFTTDSSVLSQNHSSQRESVLQLFRFFSLHMPAITWWVPLVHHLPTLLLTFTLRTMTDHHPSIAFLM